MNIRKLFHILTLAAVTLAAATSCGEGEEDDFILSPGGGSISNGDQGVPEEVQQIEKRIELPLMLDGNEFVCHKIKLGGDSLVNFCIEYDPNLHHSRWVSFRFDNRLSQKSTGRKDYNIKPQYPKDPNCASSLPDDASFKGFDHGHLCASADRLCCTEANWQTFYMTNMSPQYKQFNQDYWTSYESFVQNLARQSGFADTLYVVKGGTILPEQRITTISTAGCLVPVPEYYFIAMLKVKNDKYSSLAFWVKHEETPRGSGSKQDLAQHAITIDELEDLTGIDFFHNLPDAVENVVEASCQTSAWGL